VLKANLNSGPLVESFSPAYQVESESNATYPPAATDAVDSNGNAIESGNVGVMFNEVGEAFSLQKDQGVWMSFRSTEINSSVAVTGGNAQTLDISLELDDGTSTPITITSPTTLVPQTATQNAQTFAGAINAKSAITGVEANVRVDTAGNPFIDLVNTNATETASHNIRLTTVVGDDSGLATSTAKTAYKYQYDPAGSTATGGSDKNLQL